jgi:hypothetical protein
MTRKEKDRTPFIEDVEHQNSLEKNKNEVTNETTSFPVTF